MALEPAVGRPRHLQRPVLRRLRPLVAGPHHLRRTHRLLEAARLVLSLRSLEDVADKEVRAAAMRARVPHPSNSLSLFWIPTPWLPRRTGMLS